MTIERILKDRRKQVLARWRERIFSTYPSDSARLYVKEQDAFANPVGRTIADQTEILLKLFIDHAASQELADALMPVVKIRAIQFSCPSAALAFVPLLKHVIREVVPDLPSDTSDSAEWLRLDSRIDEMLLATFDCYAKCREEVANLRVRETVRHVSGLLRRVGAEPWLAVEEAATPPAMCDTAGRMRQP